MTRAAHAIELWEAMCKSNDVEKELATTSNDELADLLMNHVWAQMDMFSPASTLVEVVIERLRGK